MKKEVFTIGITISEFGNLAKFYKTFAKKNRIIIVENVEFEGTSEQHNTGIMQDKIVCKLSELKEKVKDYVYKNSLEQESFNICREDSKKVIMTEDDL